MEVHHFSFECVGDALYMAIDVEVDCKEHGNKLTVYFVFPILHGLVKVLNGDHRMGNHYIVYGLNLLSDCFTGYGLSKVNDGFVWLRLINPPFMRYEVNLPP